MNFIRISSGTYNTDHKDSSNSYQGMCLMSNRVLIFMMGTAKAYRRVGKDP